LKSREKVHRGIQQELFAQAARLDLASYDDPGYYNDFVLAINEAPQRFDEMMERVKQLCAQTVSGPDGRDLRAAARPGRFRLRHAGGSGFRYTPPCARANASSRWKSKACRTNASWAT